MLSNRLSVFVDVVLFLLQDFLDSLLVWGMGSVGTGVWLCVGPGVGGRVYALVFEMCALGVVVTGDARVGGVCLASPMHPVGCFLPPI